MLSFGEGSGNPLQYSCLENPMDRGTWWATVQGAAKSWRRPKSLSTHVGAKKLEVPRMTVETALEKMV